MTDLFDIRLNDKRFQSNIVLKIGSNYYSQYQVDAGLTIDSERLGLVHNATISGATVDFRDVKTSIKTVSFSLLDKSQRVTLDISASEKSYVEETVELYYGFITGSFHWSHYKKLTTTIIKTIDRKENLYNFKSNESIDLLLADIYTIKSPLTEEMGETVDVLDGNVLVGDSSLIVNDAADFPSAGLLKIHEEYITYTGKATNTLTGLGRGALGSTATGHIDGSDVAYILTSLTLGDTSDFPSSGLIKIDAEFMDYTGKTSTTLTGLTRGALGSEISTHDDGTFVNYVTIIEDNSMDLLLDILQTELGISPALIDVVAFEDLRDNELNTDGDFKFYMYDIDKALTWIEENILVASNTRIFTSKNGLISIAILDQIDPTDDVPEINESTIEGQPDYKVDSNKIVNRVNISYDWDEGTQKFNTVGEFLNQDSIDIWGEKKVLELEYKGVATSRNGFSMVENRAARIFARLATPKAEITLKTQLQNFNIDISDKAKLIHRYLPQQGGALGFDAILEVASRGLSNLSDNASITYTFVYTSFTGNRIGAIAPAKAPVSVTSQKVFTMPTGYASHYKVGYVLRLFDNVNIEYFADADNIIESINGDEITMTNVFTTTLGSNTTLSFADYANCNADQKLRYVFISPASGTFPSDGLGAYVILL